MAASCAHDVEAAARAAVTALCPGFRAHGEPRCTETSMLLGGVLDSRAVIAKYPIDRRPFWLARARHEITVYRALPALAPLPMTVPDMVAADPIHPLIVMTELAGVPLYPHRYLTGTIHSGQFSAVLSLLNRVHAWQPAIPSALPYDDYPGQLAAVHDSGINEIEHPCAVELCTAIRGRLGMDCSWFPQRLVLDAELRDGGWEGYLSSGDRRAELTDVRSVWYRTPSQFVFPSGMSESERQHAEREVRIGLGGVLVSLPMQVNDLHRVAAATKQWQLAVATACGLSVPRTRIVNRGEAACEFVAATSGGVVSKLFVNGLVEQGRSQVGHTRLLSAADLAELRGFGVTATPTSQHMWLDDPHESPHQWPLWTPMH